jgi:hypothetical protein
MSCRLAADVPYELIRAFCQKWQIVELSLFGSVLRDDFGPESDIDVLVTFAAGTRHGFLDRYRMEKELRKLFGRKVDLIERRVIEQSDNYIRRRHILESAEVVYGA